MFDQALFFTIYFYLKCYTVFLSNTWSSIVYILSCLKRIGKPNYASYTVSKQIGENEMHTLRISVMCFKKV